MNINCQDFLKLQLLTILILSFRAKPTKQLSHIYGGYF